MDMELDNIYYENYTKWKASKIKNKKVWNFPYFSKPTHPTHLVWKKNENNMV